MSAILNDDLFENVKACFDEYEQGPLRKQQIIVQAIM